MLAMKFTPVLLLTIASIGEVPDETPLAEQVAHHYVELARQRYEDSLDAAAALNEAVQAFLNEPNATTHQAAKDAWVVAHSVYSHTEVFRFGNPNVDAWESRVNAWPMDEGLIDYVADGDVHHEGNVHARANIIVEGRIPITDEVLAAFMDGTDPKAAPLASLGISDVESNVTRGYHAIEFLLWGQDLNEERGQAGQRPFTDYVEGDDCTNGRCDRRRRYLSAVCRLLMRDLEFAIRDWDANGRLYAKVFNALPIAERLERMIVGVGTLSYGELAIERMQVAFLTSDQEEEQSCFSDATHHAHYHNALSIQTTYLGRHARQNGKRIEGPSISDLVAAVEPELDARIRKELEASIALAQELVRVAEAGEPFDVMTAADNVEGRKRIQSLMNALQQQTESLDLVKALVPKLAEL